MVKYFNIVIMKLTFVYNQQLSQSIMQLRLKHLVRLGCINTLAVNQVVKDLMKLRLMIRAPSQPINQCWWDDVLLIDPEQSSSLRFDAITKVWQQLARRKILFMTVGCINLRNKQPIEIML